MSTSALAGLLRAIDALEQNQHRQLIQTCAFCCGDETSEKHSEVVQTTLKQLSNCEEAGFYEDVRTLQEYRESESSASCSDRLKSGCFRYKFGSEVHDPHPNLTSRFHTPRGLAKRRYMI